MQYSKADVIASTTNLQHLILDLNEKKTDFKIELSSYEDSKFLRCIGFAKHTRIRISHR